jgi:prepilin peptidase CpaA
MTMSLVHLLVTVGFCILLLLAAASDVLSYTIPNWISIALALLFPLAVFSNPAESAIGYHILTAAAVFAAAFALFCLRLMGGGDVKLWAAVALWVGPDLIVTHVVLVAILGGLLGLFLLLVRRTAGRPGDTPVLRSSVPYGLPIAVAALWLLPRIPVLSI